MTTNNHPAQPLETPRFRAEWFTLPGRHIAHRIGSDGSTACGRQLAATAPAADTASPCKRCTALADTQPQADDTSTPTPAARSNRHRRSAYGSVRKLSSGRWQARALDGHGEYRAAPRTFDTQRHAEDWLATHRADLLRGAWRSPHLGAVPLAEFAADWLAGRVDLAPRTRQLYTQLLATWINPELAHPTGRRSIELGTVLLRDLDTAAIREWHTSALAHAQQRAIKQAAARDRRRRSRALHAAREWAIGQGMTVKPTGRLSPALLDAWRASGAPQSSTLALPATVPGPDAGRVQVARAYAVLRTILNAAAHDGLIPANPCTIKNAGRVKTRERVPATPAEIAAIATNMPPRYAATVHVAAWSGLRAGELYALTRAHVDLTAGTVRVERAMIELSQRLPIQFGPPKTTASLRTVHLPGPVVELLRTHLATFTGPGPDALVFAHTDGTPIRSVERTRMFRAACEPLGLHDLRWHDLRHTGATLAAQAGASLRELQARLGHSTIAAAMTYQHATTERDRELADRLAGLVITGPHTDPTGQTPTTDTPRPRLHLVR